MQQWSAAHPLVRMILRRNTDFDFFQLLHLVERVAREAPPLGRQGPAAEELVRLRPSLRLSFPPGDLESTEWITRPFDDGGRFRVTTTFMGMYGSDSPLPAHFTEALLAEREDDVRTREFIDLFHHRVLSLLYRVWAKYRYHITFREDGHDPISEVIRGLLGIATSKLDEQVGVNPVRMFRYVGIFSQRPRSATGLVGQLKDYFAGIDFDLAPCVGRWLAIEDSERNVLGQRRCSLGVDFLLGERIYDRSGKFRVKVGPVGFDDYAKFLPVGSAAADVARICKLYCDDPLEFETEVTLRGEEVPETALSAPGVLGRLSWTSWLKSKPCGDKAVVFGPPRPQPASES